jgi:adenosylhomocysteine nucleosidase
MVSGQRILLVAAEPREFDGLLGHCAAVRKLNWPVDWVRYGECNDKQMWMVANGAGWAHAATAVDVAQPKCGAEAVVSMGFCGALDPGLKIGDVFVATGVARTDAQWPAQTPTPPSGHAAQTGLLASIDHIAGTVEEKAELRATGAFAVEMEAAGVAESARKYQIRFYCVRAVSDLAAESFLTDFNGALREDGHFATIRILTSALRNPRLAFPELIRLRRNCQVASRSLGEFIAGCRF